MLTLGAAGAGGSMTLMIFVVIMFVGMYFLSIRPQKKQQQKRQEMLKAMNEGDQVVTLGGLKGKIYSIDRDKKEVIVDCDGVYLTFDLNFIRRATAADKATTDAVKDDSTKPAESADTAKDDKDTDDTKEAPKEDVEPKAADDATKSEEPKTDDAADDDTKEETK